MRSGYPNGMVVGSVALLLILYYEPDYKTYIDLFGSNILDQIVDNGLLEGSPQGWRVSPKGEALVQAIMSLQVESKWTVALPTQEAEK